MISLRAPKIFIWWPSQAEFVILVRIIEIVSLNFLAIINRPDVSYRADALSGRKQLCNKEQSRQGSGHRRRRQQASFIWLS